MSNDNEPNTVPRREVLRRALIYFVEEIGIPNDGTYYKGKIVLVDDGSGKPGSNRMLIDFGLPTDNPANIELAEKMRALADGHMYSFAQSFSRKWQETYSVQTSVTEEQATAFIRSFR